MIERKPAALSREDVLAEEVTYWFDVLETDNPAAYRKEEGMQAPVSPAKFLRIIPISEMDGLIGEDYFVFTDAYPDSLDWPVDVCILATQKSWLKWIVRRFVSIGPKEARGSVVSFSRYMLKEYIWASPRNSIPVSLIAYHSFIGGRWGVADIRPKWVKIGRGFADDHYAPVKQCSIKDGLRDHEIYPVDIACGYAFNMRYHWGVELRVSQDAPSILLPTDPSGVRSIFSHRERNPLTNRRDALLHWVRDHFRKSRKEASDAIWVKKHLRGKWSFDWNGMQAIIHPSNFDVDDAIKQTKRRP